MSQCLVCGHVVYERVPARREPEARALAPAAVCPYCGRSAIESEGEATAGKEWEMPFTD